MQRSLFFFKRSLQIGRLVSEGAERSHGDERPDDYPNFHRFARVLRRNERRCICGKARRNEARWQGMRGGMPATSAARQKSSQRAIGSALSCYAVSKKGASCLSPKVLRSRPYARPHI